jgi:hypothetical protein
VSALSPAASAALLAVLFGSMWRAFLGRPARRERRSLAGALLGATGACYAGGAALVLLADAGLAGALLVGGGIEVACVGAWLVRGGDDRPDDGPGRDGPGEPTPWDWEAFDRARAAWAERRGRPRTRV